LTRARRVAGIAGARFAWLAFAVGLSACRAALGIEQLDLVDAGGDATAPAVTQGIEAGLDRVTPESGAETATGTTMPETGAPETAAEASVPEAGPQEAAPREAAPPETGASNPYAACVAMGTMCRPCCRQTYMQANIELTQDVTMGCLCGPSGSCQTDCSASLCSMTAPMGTAPTMACGMCFDMAVLPPVPAQCVNAVAQCKSSATCRDVIDCLDACP
jgi:hypothetical protein